MTYEPITLEELKALGARIDSRFVIADDEPNLHWELNTKYDHEKWTLLRAPIWIGDRLVAFIVRPRNDSEPDDDPLGEDEPCPTPTNQPH